MNGTCPDLTWSPSSKIQPVRQVGQSTDEWAQTLSQSAPDPGGDLNCCRHVEVHFAAQTDLFDSAFTQCHVGCKDFPPPAPDDETFPFEALAYMSPAWWHEDVPQIEFLRKSNARLCFAPCTR